MSEADDGISVDSVLRSVQESASRAESARQRKVDEFTEKLNEQLREGDSQ